MSKLSIFRPVLPTDALRAFKENMDEVATSIFSPESAVLSRVFNPLEYGNERSTRPISSYKMYDIGTLAMTLLECPVIDAQDKALVRVWEKMKKGNESGWGYDIIMEGFSNDFDSSGNIDLQIGGVNQQFSPSGRRKIELVFEPLAGTSAQSQLLREKAVVYNALVSLNPRFEPNSQVNRNASISFMRLPEETSDKEVETLFMSASFLHPLPTLILGKPEMKFES